MSHPEENTAPVTATEEATTSADTAPAASAEDDFDDLDDMDFVLDEIENRIAPLA